jgi:hypothetical protein
MRYHLIHLRKKEEEEEQWTLTQSRYAQRQRLERVKDGIGGRDEWWTISERHRDGEIKKIRVRCCRLTPTRIVFFSPR